jgi:Bacterial low temperature requirement A protein (LtrA)
VVRDLRRDRSGGHGRHPAVALPAARWLYFDRSAEAGAQVIERSADPGALGRSAYHFIHPVMVAGIVVVAAADDIVLSGPGARAAWLDSADEEASLAASS